jgi:hypothetical protein
MCLNEICLEIIFINIILYYIKVGNMHKYYIFFKEGNMYNYYIILYIGNMHKYKYYII